ncbi:hypothetical protein ACFWCA_18085 [Streptomyces phaeochromogenes]|uniref:hypothetical protein n=1 Tax=Streptomyces phaeochromogenes TaxID=1923 RepID=UPI0036B65559
MKLSLGVKVLIIVTCILFSVIVGIGAGWLSHQPSGRKRDAVLVGGGTFGGTLTLVILVLATLDVL